MRRSTKFLSSLYLKMLVFTIVKYLRAIAKIFSYIRPDLISCYDAAWHHIFWSACNTLCTSPIFKSMWYAINFFGIDKIAWRIVNIHSTDIYKPVSHQNYRVVNPAFCNMSSSLSGHKNPRKLSSYRWTNLPIFQKSNRCIHRYTQYLLKIFHFAALRFHLYIIISEVREKFLKNMPLHILTTSGNKKCALF